MEFLLGFAGAFVLLLLTGGSFLLGWKAKERESKKRYAVTADPVSEAKRQELKEQQAAFNDLQNYSLETAYGMTNAHRNQDE